MNRTSFTIAAMVFGLLMPAQLASADEDRSPFLPALTAQWWQWAASIPNDQNPQSDPDGSYCMVGQRGPIWFLAGGFFGANVTRSCSVPEGKALFFPIINESWFNTPDCGQNGEQFSVKKEISINKPRADHDTNLRVTLDAHDITKTSMRRIQSIPFATVFPKDNIFGDNACAEGVPLAPGVYSPSMDDGYYVLLAPLKPKADNQPYVIHFHGESPDDGNSIEDVTYNLTIVPVSLK